MNIAHVRNRHPKIPNAMFHVLDLLVNTVDYYANERCSIAKVEYFNLFCLLLMLQPLNKNTIFQYFLSHFVRYCRSISYVMW